MSAMLLQAMFRFGLGRSSTDFTCSHGHTSFSPLNRFVLYLLPDGITPGCLVSWRAMAQEGCHVSFDLGAWSRCIY